MNKNYIRGRAKEYRIIKKLRREYDIVIRSAGSKSPIDIVAIDSLNHKIIFVQSKSRDFSKRMEEKLNKKYEKLNGSFNCKFEVRKK